MPLFEDKKTSIKNGEEFMKYSDLIKVCLGNAPASGMNIQTMRKHFAILEKFENMQESKVELDELEMIAIRGSVANFPWAFVHKDLIDMSTYLDSLK